MLPDTGEPDIENIVWANKRERNLSLLIIQYGPNLPLFFFGAYSEAAVCHIECYSQNDHAVVFAPVLKKKKKSSLILGEEHVESPLPGVQ